MPHFNESLDPKDLLRDYPLRPTADELCEALFITGEAFTGDFDRLESLLDRMAPPTSWFTITSTPDGRDPEVIRRSWVGVTLPLRGDDSFEGVWVIAREAIEILEKKDPQAGKWWKQSYANLAAVVAPHIDSKECPYFLSNVSYFRFAHHCGNQTQTETTEG